MTDDIVFLIESRLLFEDNHLIIINKLAGEIVQADKTGDMCLADMVRCYLKKRYDKRGNVFLGIPHRLDRPTSGIVIFCKTSKSLERMNSLFREGKIEKTYLAITDRGLCSKIGRLEHYLYRDTQKNKSFAYTDSRSNTQKAVLEYEAIAESERYTLLKIKLITGRHHQIRAQLAACGVHIKGDLKYGFPRSNPDGGICLHSAKAVFEHPVSKELVNVIAPLPNDNIWRIFAEQVKL